MFIVLKITFNFAITIKGRQEKEQIDDRLRTAKYHQMLHMYDLITVLNIKQSHKHI